MPGKKSVRQAQPGAPTARRLERGSVTKQSRSPLAHARARNVVRIIGGAWKRTPLPVPSVDGLRPTPDRVRETLFNWLAHLVGDLEHVRGLDLFAGTGALGFELASRGAQAVTVIEGDAELARALAATRARLDARQIEIVSGDALAVAARLPAAAYDVIFIDPPFDSGLHRAALRAALRLLAVGGLIYLEAPQSLDAAALDADGLEVARSGRAGRVHFHLLRRATA